MNRYKYIIIVGVIVFALSITAFLLLNKKNDSKNTDSNKVEGVINNTQKTGYQDRLIVLKKIFAEKNNKNADDISINIAMEDKNYIKGIVNIKNDYEGIFLATKKDEKWEIVWDGKGRYGCELLKEYNFPEEIADNCQK